MKKKMYFSIENNADLSITVEDANCLENIMQGDFEGLSDKQIAEYQYTVTPVFMTQQEFDNLPESE